jgi:hypothetical protein
MVRVGIRWSLAAPVSRATLSLKIVRPGTYCCLLRPRFLRAALAPKQKENIQTVWTFSLWVRTLPPGLDAHECFGKGVWLIVALPQPKVERLADQDFPDVAPGVFRYTVARSIARNVAGLRLLPRTVELMADWCKGFARTRSHRLPARQCYVCGPAGTGGRSYPPSTKIRSPIKTTQTSIIVSRPRNPNQRPRRPCAGGAMIGHYSGAGEPAAATVGPVPAVR